MSMLERLYNDYMSDNNLGDSKEADRELGKFDEKINELLPKNGVTEVGESVLNVCAAFEKQGFMNGVKYAMQLQHECMR